MGNLKTIENLLHRVSAINEKYEEIAKITGENFNVFEVLRLKYAELKHSLFLAELLSPNGSHGLGSCFLELFIQQMKFENFSEFDCESAQVHTEYPIKYYDNYSDGRIDILIIDKRKNAVVIENKINALDLEKQLVKYDGFAKNHLCNYKILYLKPFVIEPHDRSVAINDKEKVKIKCISYKNDIKEWLETCLKESVAYPLLRETLTQYINLINHLTGQAMNHEMEIEIGEIMAASKESINAVFRIYGSREAMENKLLSKLQIQLADLLDKNLMVESIFDKNFGTKIYDTYWQFGLEKYERPELAVFFGFEKYKNRFLICLCAKDIKAHKIDEQLKASLSNILSLKIGQDQNDKDYYYLYYYDGTMANWDNPEIWQQIPDGTLAKRLNEELNKAIDGLREAELLLSITPAQEDGLAN